MPHRTHNCTNCANTLYDYAIINYELKKIGKVLTSISVGTGPSSYEKRVYWAAVSQRLRNTALRNASQTSLTHTTLHSPSLSVCRTESWKVPVALSAAVYLSSFFTCCAASFEAAEVRA